MSTDSTLGQLYKLSCLFDEVMDLMATNAIRVALLHRLAVKFDFDVFGFFVELEELFAEHGLEGAYTPEQLAAMRIQAQEQWLMFKGRQGSN